MRVKGLILVLILSLFLVNAVQTENPDSLKVRLDQYIYNEGDLVEEGEFIINFSGPVNLNTFIRGEVGDLETSVRFTDLLDDLNIDYEIEEGEFTAENPEPAKNLVFQGPGKQFIFFKLPKSSQITNIDMKIKGIPNENSYPSFVKMDVKDDENLEWHYIGSLSNFGDFVLPSGLVESNQAGSAIMNNIERYYCEIINLPSSKDFQVFAKYGFASANTVGNISAIILSLTGSGDNVNGQGGANKCDLPEPSGINPEYHECTLNFDKMISGNKLVCIYNNVAGNGNLEQYKIAVDGNQGVGYRCNNLVNGQTTCQIQPADFFIKIKPGVYSGTLNSEVPLSAGLTEFLFNISVTNYLNTCTGVNNVCVVPISVSSDSRGILILDDLELKYKIGGTQFIENSFYEGTATTPGITELDGVSLLNNTYSLEVAIGKLNLLTPSITQAERNFTLRVSADPGPSDSKTITVKKTFVNATSDRVEDIVDSYKGILNDIIGKYSQLLQALELDDGVNDAVSKLTSFKNQLTALNSSNKTEAQKNTERTQIRNQVMDLVKNLPRVMIVSKSVSDTIPAGYDDLIDDVLLEDQRTEQSKNKIYDIQTRSNVDGRADLYEMTRFDGTRQSGTLITKRITSPATNAYAVEIIPSSVTSSLNDILFLGDPEIIKQSNPIIARWSFTNIQDNTISYTVKKDVIGKLGSLKTLVIPKAIEEPTIPPLAECGDGVCSFIEIEGEKVYLEDKFSCPADCKKKYPVAWYIIGFIIIGLIIYYVNYYKGKYNFNEIVDILRKKLGFIRVKSEKPIKSLFISKVDEENLKNYVKNALGKGIDKGRITSTLLGKGWTREQVDYVFKDLKK